MMKTVRASDFLAVGLGGSGLLISAIAVASGNDEGFLFEVGGLLTWGGIAVAIYGFVSRSLGK